MSALRLSGPARALVAFVRRVTTTDERLWREFVFRRGYYPEDLERANGEALVADGDTLHVGGPR